MLAQGKSAALEWRGEGENEEGISFEDVADRANEAYELGKEFIAELPGAVGEAAMVCSYISRKRGDWSAAQAILDEASELIDGAAGRHAEAACSAFLRFADVLFDREQFGRALGVLDDRLRDAPAATTWRVVLELYRVRSLSGLSRHDEAIAGGRAALGHAIEAFGDVDPVTLLAARGLALAQVAAGRELDLALTLAERACVPPPSEAEGVPRYLDGVLALLRVLLKRGDAARAVRTADLAQEVLSSHQKGFGAVVGPELEFWGLRAEALGAIGMVKEAAERYRAAIRQVKESSYESHPSLIPLLEGLSRTLPDSQRAHIEDAVARAESLRSLVTGRPPAPRTRVQQPGAPAVGSDSRPRSKPSVESAVWPRRTLSGVVSLSNVDEAALTKLLMLLGRPSAGFGAILTAPGEAADQVTLALEDWEEPFEPQRVLRNRNFAVRLIDLIKGINAARNESGVGLGEIRILPWWSVEDAVEIAWWNWPSGMRESWERLIFPRLPGWRVGSRDYSWLGSGMKRREDGGLASASPSLVLKFLPEKGICFRGRGGAQELDEWFSAFAHATTILPPRLYTQISPPDRGILTSLI